jgi:hypothetical protein
MLTQKLFTIEMERTKRKRWKRDEMIVYNAKLPHTNAHSMGHTAEIFIWISVQIGSNLALDTVTSLVHIL